MNVAQVKRIIEAALLCAQQPMPVSDIRRLFDGDVELSADTVRALLDELRAEWSGRAVELAPLASGWRFQSTPELAPYVARLQPDRPARYSRAVMETLAIIAYRQPVTRGEIEEIRGVSVSSQIVRTLEDRGWVEVVGHKEVIGRPALLATTAQFLDDLGLRSLQELPALDAQADPVAALFPVTPVAVATAQPVVPMSDVSPEAEPVAAPAPEASSPRSALEAPSDS